MRERACICFIVSTFFLFFLFFLFFAFAFALVGGMLAHTRKHLRALYLFILKLKIFLPKSFLAWTMVLIQVIIATRYV